MTGKQIIPSLTHSSLTTEEWMTTEEVAAYLKIPIGTLRNMTSNGRLPFYKLGRRNRYLRSDLRQLLFSNKKGVIYGD